MYLQRICNVHYYLHDNKLHVITLNRALSGFIRYSPFR